MGGSALRRLASEPGGIRLWRVDLDAYAATQAPGGLNLDELQRAARFAFEPLRRRSRAGRHALRQVLGRALRCPPEALLIEADRFGKPSLTGVAGSPGTAVLPHFSYSHREGHGLIGVHATRPIGVDLELPKALDDLDGLAAACFSEAERAELATLEPARRSVFFLRCWTRKEACLKALGVGLSAPLPAVDVGGGMEERPLRLALPAGDIEVCVQGVVLGDDGLHAACAWTDGPSIALAHAAWG